MVTVLSTQTPKETRMKIKKHSLKQEAGKADGGGGGTVVAKEMPPGANTNTLIEDKKDPVTGVEAGAVMANANQSADIQQ